MDFDPLHPTIEMLDQEWSVNCEDDCFDRLGLTVFADLFKQIFIHAGRLSDSFFGKSPFDQKPLVLRC